MNKISFKDYEIQKKLKIPILNFILYLESKEFLSIFLTLIEVNNCKLLFSID